MDLRKTDDEQLLEQAEGIMTLIRQISAAIDARTASALRQDSITLPQFKMLLAADSADAENTGELVERLHCSRGDLTGVLDRLEPEAGWSAIVSGKTVG